jgi:hypothetical protein
MASAGAVRDRGAASTAGFFVLLVCAAICCCCVPAIADDSVRASAVPSFAELQAAGAVIGEVRINPQNIFDLDDPKENNALFRLANRLHIQTRPSVIRGLLLFHSGERVSLRVIEESERVLRANSYLYDVNIRPVAYRGGIVDIEVHTRDTWSLQPGFSFSRGGGSNSGGLTVKEKNLFGTGVSVGIAGTSTVDRSGTEFEVAHNQVFGGRTAFSLKRADYGDGASHSVSLVHPFYALDTRWALGASTGQFDQVDSIYSNSAVVGQYRHRQRSGEAFGGWSNGLVDGWVQRYSVGVIYTDDRYEVDPSRVPPARLPPDQELAYPFIRYEVIEDKFARVRNRDKIGRPEFFAMGFTSRVQVGRASTGFGSTRDLWLYSGAISKGFESVGGGELLTGLTFSGQYGDGRGERQFVGDPVLPAAGGSRTIVCGSIPRRSQESRSRRPTPARRRQRPARLSVALPERQSAGPVHHRREVLYRLVSVPVVSRGRRGVLRCRACLGRRLPEPGQSRLAARFRLRSAPGQRPFGIRQCPAPGFGVPDRFRWRYQENPIPGKDLHHLLSRSRRAGRAARGGG